MYIGSLLDGSVFGAVLYILEALLFGLNSSSARYWNIRSWVVGGEPVGVQSGRRRGRWRGIFGIPVKPSEYCCPDVAWGNERTNEWPRSRDSRYSKFRSKAPCNAWMFDVCVWWVLVCVRFGHCLPQQLLNSLSPDARDDVSANVMGFPDSSLWF